MSIRDAKVRKFILCLVVMVGVLPTDRIQNAIKLAKIGLTKENDVYISTIVSLLD